MLVGRDSELERIHGLIGAAEAGAGGALVLLGEAGIGKTSLLAEARERSRSPVISTIGVETESELPFAGLADVVRPILGSLGELAPAQAEAIRAALGLAPPAPVDRLTLGGATLSLIAAAAPLLVLVDDAHWLDGGSQDALLFAAHRLASDPVAILFAAREGDMRQFDAPGLEELRLSGLEPDHALALLGDRVPSSRVARRLVEQTGGNPLALVELPSALSDAQLAGSEPLEDPLRLGNVLERGFSRQAQLLGEPARFALLLAAADSSGEVEAVASVVDPVDLDRVEDAGLIRRHDGRIEFRHPLVRSAVYHGAAPSERRRAHALLAHAMAGRDAERRAWHLAAAAVGVDEDAAAGLAQVAEASARRGGYDTAAAAFERAARLGRAGSRATRLAAAADAAILAGRTARAGSLVAEGLAAQPDERALSALLAARGTLAALAGDQRAAFDAFLEASTLVGGDDAATLLSKAVGAGVQLGGEEVAQAAERLRAVALPGDHMTELLVAQAVGAAESVAGDPESVRSIARGVELIDRGLLPLKSANDLLWAGQAYFMLARNSAAVELGRRAIAVAAETGALGLLTQAQRLVASAAFEGGDWRVAYGVGGEAVALAKELGQHVVACASLGVLAEIDAAAGNEPACRDHAEAAIALARDLGLGFFRERAERALGHLELALGRPERAAELLEAVAARLRTAGNFEINVTPSWDLVEAYVRLGRDEDAQRTLERAEREMPPASPNELAVVYRCRGLLADDFRPLFEEAIALDQFPFDRARAQLCYGQRLRRAGERLDSRTQLHAAVEGFDSLGAAAWASRAEEELRASGERRRSREASRERLTPRETQIALAVADGQSNRDVAAALFVTPKTVEFHLTRVYRKLGVRSRAELVKRYRAQD